MHVGCTAYRKTTMDLFSMKTFSLLCLLLNAISCEYFEPCCTTCDFAERLLENTIRFEFEMRQIKKEYTQMIDELLEERKNINNERELMRETIENSLKQSLQKLNTIEGGVKDTGEKLVKDANDATTAMEVTQRQNEAKLMRLSADQDESIQNIKKTLNELPDVFFMANDLIKYIVLQNKTFVFMNVTENISGGYNNDDGIFTVPFAGDYLFTTQLCNASERYVHFGITIDGERKKLAMVSTKGKHSCTTATLIARVKKGSRVAVESTFYSDTFCDKHNYGCYFSGYLLKPTLY